MKNTACRPFLLGAVAFLFAAWFSACQSRPTQAAEDLGRLQGYWEGKGPGGECSVTISGNSLLFHAREDFWYETSFTLAADSDPPQLHATILKDSSSKERDIGKVVVAVFKIEDGRLDLGVIKTFEGPPADPPLGDWDAATDRYYLNRAQPPDK